MKAQEFGTSGKIRPWFAALALSLLPVVDSPAAPAPALKPPAAFKATATSATSIQLKWRDTNSVEKNYLLEFRKGSGAFQQLGLLPKNSKSYAHRNLVGGTTYTYRLSAVAKKKRSATRMATATTSTQGGSTPTPSGTVATPTFDTAAGSYTSDVLVSISTTTAGATIRYTTDGSDPTATDAIYTSALSLTTTTTLKARAFKAGSNDSAVAAATYTIVVADPVFTPGAGTYSNAVMVTVTCDTPDATIRCTVNGSDPTTASTAYNGPITISANLTLKARAFKTGASDSAITSGDYVINTMATVATPTITPNGGTFTGTVSVTLATTTAGATIRYTTNGTDPTAASTLYTTAFPLSSSATVKARAFKAGSNDSLVASAPFTINATPTVATPIISPVANTYTDNVSASITCATAGATIYYTTNGATPTAASTAYTTAIPITTTTTLKAIGIKAGSNNSAVASSTFTIVSSATRAGLSARPESTTSVRLNWLNIVGNQTSGMTIQRSTSGVDATYINATAATAAATTFLNTGLAAKTIYYYRARPTGSSGAWSYASTATLSASATGVPNPPSNLQVYPDVPQGTELPQVLLIRFKRNATNETHYVLENSTDGEAFTLEGEVPITNVGTIGVGESYIADNDLPANTKYYYRVRAKNGNGLSDPTDVVAGTTFTTTAPTAPAALAAQATSPTQLTLTWTNTSQNEGYEVHFVQGAAGGTFTEYGKVTPGNVIGVQTLSDLTAGTTYRWKIRAYVDVNRNGAIIDNERSPFSNTVTVTMPAAAATTSVKFTNNNAYPIISLKIDGVEKFTAAPQGMPPANAANPPTFTISLAAGQHTYVAQNGFWQDGSRFTLYTYSNTFTVTNGQTTALSFSNPTIQQLMTQFRGASGTGLWSGWYSGANGFTPIYVRFFANGTCTLSHNPNGSIVTVANGTYAMQTNGYQGTFVANFNMVFNGNTYSAKLSETGGWFGATLSPLINSPYAIQFNADGP